MKKLFATMISILINIICFAQRGEIERTYEVIGLPNSKVITKSLKVAIPLLVIGFLIAYIFMWRKKDISKVDNTSTNIGCFGVIIMAIGIVYLLPLLAWVEYIFVSMMTIGFIVALIYAIYSAFRKK